MTTKKKIKITKLNLSWLLNDLILNDKTVKK
jgi:hypothetical protein